MVNHMVIFTACGKGVLVVQIRRPREMDSGPLADYLGHLGKVNFSEI
jgi:hypothetical protein